MSEPVTHAKIASMRLVLAALALTLLTACGGGDDSTPAPTADDLAAEIGCEGDSADEEHKVSCETDDAFFGITVYESNESRDADVEAATSAGATVLVGDRFLIDSSSAAALEQAQKAVGGEIR